MPYILNKTNGEKLTTIADGSLYLGTDLVFVGKNFAGYGEILNENLLKLLENFANSTQPKSPIRGQLWYDYATKKLKIYSGQTFKSLSRLECSSITPTDSTIGDMWWDTSLNKLKLYNGAAYLPIGGSGGTVSTGQTGKVVDIIASTVISDSDTTYDILKYVINDIVVAVAAGDAITIKNTDALYTSFPVVKKGITLAGADANGSSISTSSFFWGTSSDSVRLNNQPASAYVLRTELPSLTTSSLFVGTLTASVVVNTPVLQSVGTAIIKGSWTLDTGVHLNATYADIAERYAADAWYTSGTVLTIGGSHEVTKCTTRADTSVAGIVSVRYAHLLNSDAGNEWTHPAIALVGRVPCLVVGPVEKGDLLVSSSHAGHAEKWKMGDNLLAVIAKALQSTNKEYDTIEVKV